LVNQTGRKRASQKLNKDMIKKMYFKKQKERLYLSKYIKQRRKINCLLPMLIIQISL
jgi:uncharacterized membrane protein YbaN (DUF454 family)